MKQATRANGCGQGSSSASIDSVSVAQWARSTARNGARQIRSQTDLIVGVGGLATVNPSKISWSISPERAGDVEPRESRPEATACSFPSTS